MFGFSVENVRFLKPGDKSRCTYVYSQLAYPAKTRLLRFAQ